MKKFFTVVPLQGEGQLKSYQYDAVGNTRLQMNEATCFPILTAVNGHVEPGENFRVIAVMTNNEDCRRNAALFQTRLDQLCQTRGFCCPKGVELIPVEADERVAAHVATFQKLIDFVEDDDELFACMTYGTKPLSTAVMMAVQYAYRVKKNTSISCIVYGLVDRSVQPPRASVYDMTALIQLDEIVRVLADRGVKNPKETIDRILAL